MLKKKSLRAVLRGALCLVLCTSMQAFAQNESGNHAQEIFQLTNRDRVNRGLPPLAWDASLAAAAQAHAERMVTENALSHQYPGEEHLTTRAARAGAHFQAIAENIATGYGVEAIENEWMGSTPHRTNILDPKMNSIGVGVVAKGGTLYAVEDFAEAAKAFSPSQIESRVGSLLRSRNIDPSGPRDSAAQVCSSDSGYPKGETVKLVIRFTASDLTQLPALVASQLQSGNYRRASVAACSPGGGEDGFTTYRIAIVLY